LADVKVKNLTKVFGKVTAVDNLNLEVEDRKFVCLLGPSGCGKTTTLRCIAGLETPDKGEIYIGGELVNELTPSERDIAMVFQFYALYPTLDVYDNLAFPLNAQKISKSEIDKMVKEVAETLRITGILHLRADQLTPGEAQRVALGRAIIRRPKVYLLDEPLTNLDAKLRAYMRAELKRLQKDLGQTAIYVTHDQLEAMTMADKIAVMNQGILQQYDTPEEIYDHPRNLFVAGFIGSPSMNFMECELHKNHKYVLKTDDFEYDVTEYKDLFDKEASSEEVILGVRPEDIAISKRKPGGLAFQAEVYVVEPMGDQMIVNVKFGGYVLKAITEYDPGLKVGEKVWTSLNEEKVHFIDRKTEKVIL
jgi:multiple sugar transport system ATP-binding protein